MYEPRVHTEAFYVSSTVSTVYLDMYSYVLEHVLLCVLSFTLMCTLMYLNTYSYVLEHVLEHVLLCT